MPCSAITKLRARNGCRFSCGCDPPTLLTVPVDIATGLVADEYVFCKPFP